MGSISTNAAPIMACCWVRTTVDTSRPSPRRAASPTVMPTIGLSRVTSRANTVPTGMPLFARPTARAFSAGGIQRAIML